MQDQKSFDKWAAEALPHVGSSFEVAKKDDKIGISFMTGSGRAFFPIQEDKLHEMLAEPKPEPVKATAKLKYEAPKVVEVDVPDVPDLPFDEED